MATAKAALIPKSVILMGLVSLCINSSTIVIVSLSPYFLTYGLGLTTMQLGAWEGFIEFCAWSTRIAAGFLCDIIPKRKWILVPAYGLIALTRPIIGFVTSLSGFFTCRLLDRIGNGLGAPPREAFVSDAAPIAHLGANFGIRESLAKTGSFLGALVLIFFIHQKENIDYQKIFFTASLPAVFAFLILVFFIKESRNTTERTADKSESAATENAKKNSLIEIKTAVLISITNLRKLGPQYWKIIAISSLFYLSMYSDAFIGLRGKEVVDSWAVMPIFMIVQNAACALTSFPVGRLSDRLGRVKILIFGFCAHGIHNLLISQAQSWAWIITGAIFWGIQVGTTQSMFVTLIADVSKKEFRGIAFGTYYIISGIGILIGNINIGYLIDRFGYPAGLLTSTVIAASAIVLTLILNPQRNPKPHH